jgi:hypothetical protein
MNNTTNETYHSLKYWYSLFGYVYAKNIVNVVLIPIGLTGAVLNILALIVMRANAFNNLPFYTFLKEYTYCSLFICLLNATLFTSGTRYLIKFSNSKGSFEYYSHFFGPLITVTNFYGSFIDVVLSMERIVLLSKKLEWFKKINPKLLCLIFAIISNVIAWPFWILYIPKSFTAMLNETTPFVIHFYNVKEFSGPSSYYFDILRYFIDIFPIVLETTFNIISVCLIKKFAKNKMRITHTPRTDQITIQPTNTNPITVRARRMEVKLTILVIFLSTLSTL